MALPPGWVPPQWDPKDPSDIVDYWFDFGSTDLPATERFLDAANNVTAATVSIQPEPDQPQPVLPSTFLVLIDQSFIAKKVRYRVSGGKPLSENPIDCVIDTSSGERFNITRTLIIKERTK